MDTVPDTTFQIVVILNVLLSPFSFKFLTILKISKNFYLHVFISIYNKYCNIIYSNIVNAYQYLHLDI